MKTSKQIRQDFLDFFASKEHKVVASSPVVPNDDPTLMFVNAGMNQFKNIFLGQEKSSFSRACDTQKCIRVSGKHNDLNQVGRDGYHHTFFEMLGNWSFADYYKKEACQWAWELLTEVWQLDKDRLYITVFEDDEQAVEIWQEITGRDEKSGLIQRHSAKDNFWEMGETGPCGPCTEIHYDRTPDKSGGKLVNADCEDVIEIWNLVFMQYNRKQNGDLEELANKHIDTGMGFERIVSVIQQKKSNYDTDIFTPILEEISKISSVEYKSGEEQSIPHQVIADHIRMVAFCIADGALPANEGRGYVVRRILRRACRFGRKLGLEEPFLYKLISVLCKIYGEIFPEIIAQDDFLINIIKAEETSFAKNLDRGIKIFEELTSQISKGKKISGKDAFLLYDTYGFPIDMTCQMAEEAGLAVNIKSYQKHLEKRKGKSRADKSSITSDWIKLNDIAQNSFKGYQVTSLETRVAQYRNTEEKNKDGQDIYQIILVETPFYAESGGQVGDSGSICGITFKLNVFDTKKIDNQHICLATYDKATNSKELEISSSDTIIADIENNKRQSITKNHSATHLMHQALKDILGNHIQQKGSLVDSHGLRFDFTHFEKMTSEQINNVEKIVNEQIQANTDVTTSIEDIQSAKKRGAQALFGEKYGEKVRVLEIGTNLTKGKKSIELCGGTHVKSTGEIGCFKITSESSISSGIRRIEAKTNKQALKDLALLTFDTYKKAIEKLKEIDLFELENNELKQQLEIITNKVNKFEINQQILKENIIFSEEVCKNTQNDNLSNYDKLATLKKLGKEYDKIINSNNKILEKRKAIEKENKELKSKLIISNLDNYLEQVQKINSIKVLATTIDGVDANSLKDIAYKLRDKLQSGICILGANLDSNASLVITITDDLIKQGFHSGELIKPIAQIINGGGGGVPKMAQAGGRTPENLEKAYQKAISLIKEKN